MSKAVVLLTRKGRDNLFQYTCAENGEISGAGEQIRRLILTSYQMFDRKYSDKGYAGDRREILNELMTDYFFEDPDWSKVKELKFSDKHQIYEETEYVYVVEDIGTGLRFIVLKLLLKDVEFEPWNKMARYENVIDETKQSGFCLGDYMLSKFTEKLEDRLTYDRLWYVIPKNRSMARAFKFILTIIEDNEQYKASEQVIEITKAALKQGIKNYGD